MPYDYSLTALIPASARDIYNAWLDSLAHSEMTGGQANISSEPGGAFSAWDGYISGRNLELVPGERIVQAWRTTKFDEDHEDSIVTITLEDRDDGALLTLSHSNVPDSHLGYEQGGWHTHYFEPMIAYFTGKRTAGGEGEEMAEPAPNVEAAPAPARPRASRPARRPRAKRAAVKKAPKAKPKRATAKKAAAARAKPKRAAARKKPVAKKAAAKGRRKAAAPAAKAKAKAKGRAPKAKKAAAASRRR
ncbi:MAG TPA: SRPBCC domain-containing protein, partial [Dongiaceae bacterium]